MFQIPTKTHWIFQRFTVYLANFLLQIPTASANLPIVFCPPFFSLPGMEERRHRYCFWDGGNTSAGDKLPLPVSACAPKRKRETRFKCNPNSIAANIPVLRRRAGKKKLGTREKPKNIKIDYLKSQLGMSRLRPDWNDLMGLNGIASSKLSIWNDQGRIRINCELN